MMDLDAGSHPYTGPAGGRELCCPCHRLPVAGGPARVWCRVSGRQFQADDPSLRWESSAQPNAKTA
jgi:hypothetical protein